jgi:hypothetical protein
VTNIVDDDYELVESTRSTSQQHANRTAVPLSSLSMKAVRPTADSSSTLTNTMPGDFDLLPYADRLGECVRALITLSDRVLRESSLSMKLSLHANSMLSTSPSFPSTLTAQLTITKDDGKECEASESLALAIRLHTLALSILKVNLEDLEKASKNNSGFASQPTMQFFLSVRIDYIIF